MYSQVSKSAALLALLSSNQNCTFNSLPVLSSSPIIASKQNEKDTEKYQADKLPSPTAAPKCDNNFSETEMLVNLCSQVSTSYQFIKIIGYISLLVTFHYCEKHVR